MKPISFRPLVRDDLPQLCRWLNTPHVYQWWGVQCGSGALGGAGHDATTSEQVEKKYGDTIDHGGTTQRFIILADDAPIGLIQWYRLSDFTEYARAMAEEPKAAAAMDIFIGEASALGQGLGSQAVADFIAGEVFRHADIERVVASPAVTNHRSIRAFERAGFKWRREAQVPGEKLAAAVLVLKRR